MFIEVNIDSGKVTSISETPIIESENSKVIEDSINQETFNNNDIYFIDGEMRTFKYIPKNTSEPKTEIELLQEKLSLQDAAIMELAQMLGEVMV